jgi:Yip1 domain
MGDPLAPPPSPDPVVPEKSGGVFQDLLDVYFAPREAFERIVRHRRWLLPAVGMVVVSLAFAGVWLSRMQPREFLTTQLQESGQWDKIPAENREHVLDQQAKFIPIFTWIMAPLGAVVILVVVAGALLFVFRFFYAGEVGFRQALAVVAWTFFAVGLVTSPLTLAVMGLKGDWNLNPQDVLQANLGLLLDRAETAKPLWALATSLDLFSFWIIFLLATGFAVASRKATGSALWGVVIPWALVVVVKVGWAAVF